MNNKHLLAHWWKYLIVLILGLLAYQYIPPLIQTVVGPKYILHTEPTTSKDTDTEPAEQAEVEETTTTTNESQADKIMEEYTLTDSGLGYKIINKGEGGASPEANSRVKVHYHGTLLDGTVFDSSKERGETISFGLNQVIPGWTEGLQLMEEGDTFEFYIPAFLAYGDQSPSPLIPAGSDLIFEVELFEVQ